MEHSGLRVNTPIEGFSVFLINGTPAGEVDLLTLD